VGCKNADLITRRYQRLCERCSGSAFPQLSCRIRCALGSRPQQWIMMPKKTLQDPLRRPVKRCAKMAIKITPESSSGSSPHPSLSRLQKLGEPACLEHSKDLFSISRFPLVARYKVLAMYTATLPLLLAGAGSVSAALQVDFKSTGGQHDNLQP
jgi:hypothetical protein